MDISSLTDDPRLIKLMWMGERIMGEVSALRDMDDKLFNWTATLFVTSFGALVGLRGFTDVATWTPIWRTMLGGAVVAIVIGVLLMAWTIRTTLLRKQGELHEVMVAMGREEANMVSSSALDSLLFFVIRWGMVVLLGIVAFVLVWISLPT